MAVITLTSDWRNNDYYVGAVKGKILTYDSSTTIVDINHHIAPFNIMQAAFVLRNCYAEFPANTVHILGVNSVLSSKKPLLIIEKNDQFFLCSDCGFPTLLFPDEEKKVYKYSIKDNEGGTFISLNQFVEIAFKLINGEKPESFAVLSDDYVQQRPLLPTIDSNLINGSVVYIDSYSNAITNITKDIFDRVGKGSPFEIFVQSNHYVIDRISNTYSDVASGELVAFFNSIGVLEIAMVNGPIAQLLNLSTNSVIRIKFSNKKKANQLF